MGDPRKQRSKFSTPVHPWQKERIDEEKELIKEYGFKNKQEIWKMGSLLRNFSNQAKKLSALKTEQNEKEKIQLLNKLKSLGLLQEAADLDDVLELSLKDISERRLQSVVFRKGLARSMKQARQFITHEHISVSGKKISSPSFLVSKDQEGQIGFAPDSDLTDEMHPERIKEEKLPKKPEKKEIKKGKPKKPVKKEVKKEKSKKDEKPKGKEENGKTTKK